MPDKKSNLYSKCVSRCGTDIHTALPHFHRQVCLGVSEEEPISTPPLEVLGAGPSLLAPQNQTATWKVKIQHHPHCYFWGLPLTQWPYDPAVQRLDCLPVNALQSRGLCSSAGWQSATHHWHKTSISLQTTSTGRSSKSVIGYWSWMVWYCSEPCFDWAVACPHKFSHLFIFSPIVHLLPWRAQFTVSQIISWESVKIQESDPPA